MGQQRRVVITGMGAITPLGHSVAQTWDSLLQGKSGIGVIDTIDTTDFTCKIAGLIKDFKPDAHGISAKEARKMDVFIHYGLAAAYEAMADSGLEITPENEQRVGVCVGSGIGGITQVETNSVLLEKSGPRRISPFFIPNAIINMASGHISIKYGAKGPNLALVTACTTGTHSIGVAARMIKYGDADVMIAGGTEKASSPIGISGFAAMRALSTRNDAPEQASRPWDTGRDGFVLADGSGVLILEELEHAKARGAKIYGELIGFGTSGDAYHMTSPSGDGAAQSMENALKDAQVAASDVGHINAHATSTPVGDSIELDAARKVFGDHVTNIAMSATKSMTGHLLGAAGAIEAIFSVKALEQQIVPPTINLDNPDPAAANLNLVPGTPQELKLDIAMSNSFGFGGTNGTLVFKRYS